MPTFTLRYILAHICHRYCRSLCLIQSSLVVPTSFYSEVHILDWAVLFGNTVKPVLSGHSKRRPKIGLQDRLLLNAGQKHCRMLQGEHSAILSTFIKLPFIIKILLCLFLSGRLRQVLLYIF